MESIDLGTRIANEGLRIYLETKEIEDQLIQEALASIGMLDLANEVIRNRSKRMLSLLRRNADISVAKEPFEDRSRLEYGWDISVFIGDKLFRRRRMSFRFGPRW